MRVILLGRKPVACKALRYLCGRNIEVVAVVGGQTQGHTEQLDEVAQDHKIPVLSEESLYAELELGTNGSIDLRDVDLVLSVLHQHRIKRPLIDLGAIGCVNIHPAPLPEYRGWGTYNFGIIEDAPQWGASAHFVIERLDAGPIIWQERFDVDMSQHTAFTLEQWTQPVVYEVFKRVVDMAVDHRKLPSEPQRPSRYLSKRLFREYREIRPHDSPEMVARKARAFWYPPYQGAQVNIGGVGYTLVTQDVMNSLVPPPCDTASSPSNDASVECPILPITRSSGTEVAAVEVNERDKRRSA